jgi:aminoglycoside 2''-phosphotransferase
VVDVNNRLIFRFPRRKDVEKSVKREVALLRLLQGALPYSIPTPEFVWHGDRKVPTRFFGYPKLRGASLTGADMASSPASVASQVSRLINAIQSFPLTETVKSLFSGHSAQMWKDEYASLLSRVRRRVVGLLDTGTREKTLALFGDFLNDEGNFSFRPVLVHRDLNTNILFDKKRTEISGVIDWGDASIGDPAFDFCGFLHSQGRSFVELILQGYRGLIDESFRRRMEFYSKVIPYHVILGAMTTGRPYRIEGDDVVLGRGPAVSVFKMFESSNALGTRCTPRSKGRPRV